MASSWRDILPKVLAEREAVAVNDVSAVCPSDTAQSTPNCTNCTNCTLPAELIAGVGRLKSMHCPRGVEPAAWAEAVADAVLIADEGWADQALSLGWSALDLFGAVIGKNDDPRAGGLAVWLSRRKLRAISVIAATAVDAAGKRHCFNRPRAAGARLLWELGRGNAI